MRGSNLKNACDTCYRWAIAGGLMAVVIVLATCTMPATPPPQPTQMEAAMEPTPLPSLPFEPHTPMPTVSPTPSPPATEAPATVTPVPTPTLVPLPQTCLVDPSDRDALVGCTAYTIKLAVNPEAAQVTGEQTILYTNTEDEPLAELYLQLQPNTPNFGGRMTVKDLTIDGAPVVPAPEQANTALRIPLAEPLPVGRTTTLAMGFVVDVPRNRSSGHGLFSYVNGVMALPGAYPFIPVYDDEGWNIEIAPEYGDDLYADAASFSVEITAPETMTLIASGTCTGFPGRWSCQAGPMREFTMILGEDYQRRSRRVDGIVVNSYAYRRHDAGGQQALDYAVNAIAAFNDLFGPYPYTEYDVVETPSLLGGMEYPGLVVVRDSYYTGHPTLEWLVAHETAHQWWFGVVGSDQIDDPWLDESLTSYSTMLYYEVVRGEQTAQGVINGEFRATHRQLIAGGNDLPVGLPAGEYANWLYWDVLYRKGPLYFQALREEVGDETFFAILRAYYEAHRYTIATPESLLDTIESVAGDRYAGLYAEWIEGEE